MCTQNDPLQHTVSLSFASLKRQRALTEYLSAEPITVQKGERKREGKKRKRERENRKNLFGSHEGSFVDHLFLSLSPSLSLSLSVSIRLRKNAL
jgi:hypothetical protein